MKKILSALFALVTVLSFVMCTDDDVTPSVKPNVIKAYLAKADFKARIIPGENGKDKILLLDNAMKLKVDSVLCLGGLGPDRLNFLQNADESAIDRLFFASVAQVERELSAMNLLGTLRVYSRELQQYRADSTLELCYKKVFGDSKFTTVLGYDTSFSEKTTYADDFIEEFGQPDPLQDFSMVTRATLHVNLSGNEDAIGGRIKVFTADPYSADSHILYNAYVTESLEITDVLDIPKNLTCVYVLLQIPLGYINYKPVLVENGMIEASFSIEPEDES